MLLLELISALTTIGFFLGGAVLFIWGLVSVLKSEFKDSTTKLIWIIVVIVLPIIGPLLFFFIGKKQTIGKVEKTDK